MIEHAIVTPSAGRRGPHGRTPTGRRPGPAWAVFAAVLGATLLGGTGEAVQDAALYWNSTLWWVTGGGVPLLVPGQLEVRGVLTAVVYAPAALVTVVGGDHLAGAAVLGQNALLVAATAAFLVPALVRPWRTVSVRGRWLAGGLTWAVLHGFAPYPLVDLPAAVAVLVAVMLLGRRDPVRLGLAGLALGCAVNLRPASVVAAVLLGVVTVPTLRARSLLVLPGLAAALAPQAVVTAAVSGSVGLTPPLGGALVRLQTGYAAYVVRYDTYRWRPEPPQQFFCSPGAARVAEPLPESAGELALAMVRHLPGSAVLALEKVAAALHWPLATPYADSSPGLDALNAAGVTALAVLGCGYLLVAPLRRRPVDPGLVRATARVVAVGAGTVVVLVGSTPETRFALPLVLLGVVGVVAAAGHPPAAFRTHPRLLVGALLAVVGVLALGYAGTAHPAPPGDVTPAVCAST